MRARFGRGGSSGGKKRIWCRRHEAWHSRHAAEHCLGKICRWWKAGLGKRCPMTR
jgi:hypothetical protein